MMAERQSQEKNLCRLFFVPGTRATGSLGGGFLVAVVGCALGFVALSLFLAV